MSQHSQSSDPLADFGANEWLVDEQYERYQEDKASVDAKWQRFFETYDPQPDTTTAESNGQAADSNGHGAESNGHAAPVNPQAAAAPAPAPAPAAPAPARGPGPPAPATRARRPRGGARTGTGAAAHPGTQRAAPCRRQPGPQGPAAGATVRRGRGRPAARRGRPHRHQHGGEPRASRPRPASARSRPSCSSTTASSSTTTSRRGRGGKVSFTHLIGYALVKALADAARDEPLASPSVDGKPTLVDPDARQPRPRHRPAEARRHPHARRAVASRPPRRWTSRAFWTAYEDVVRRPATNKLTVDDFAGTTISLTNPGTIGTVHSVPRLMARPGRDHRRRRDGVPRRSSRAPREETLARNAVSKIMTLTSTYDHRIIQGAQSGEFLRRVHQLLLGEDGFYDEIFRALRIPYEPIRWVTDIVGRPRRRGRQAGPGHRADPRLPRARPPDGRHRPARVRAAPPPRPRRRRRTASRCGTSTASSPPAASAASRCMKLRDILGVLRDSYCRTVGIEYMHIQDPEQRRWIQERVERPPHQAAARGAAADPAASSTRPRRSRPSCRPSSSGRSGSRLEGGESRHPAARRDRARGRATTSSTRSSSAWPHRGRLNVLANIVGKSLRPDLPRVRGQHRPAHRPRLRRREVPPRRRGHLHRARRRRRSRSRWRPTRRTSRPSTRCSRASPGPSRTSSTAARRLHRAAAADPRRRGVRRPGRRRRDAEPVPAARLPHRRHRPRRRQQPGRLHHLAGRVALSASTAPTSRG